MKIKLALEWFINPDHLPFIVGLDKGLYKKNNIDLHIIEPEGLYDGFKELAQNNIQLATNEPLHLIEKYINVKFENSIDGITLLQEYIESDPKIIT